MISPSWGFPPRRRQRWGESRLFSRITEHPLAGNPDATTDPKPSPDLAVSLALPGGCLQSASMATSRAWSRRLRPPALCWAALSGGMLPGLQGVERAGKIPGRTDPRGPVGQASAGRGGGTHRPTSAAPKGRTSPSWPPAVLPAWSTPRSASWRCPVRLHRIALAVLERGLDPGDCLLAPLLEPENLHTKLPRH